MLLKFLGKYRDAGLLTLRIGLGIAFILHGIAKFAADATALREMGSAIRLIGLPGSTYVWGAIAAGAEAAGGFLLIIGLVYRPVCLILSFVMIMATAHLYVHGKTHKFSGLSHPLEMAFVFLGLATVGPGRFSIDKD